MQKWLTKGLVWGLYAVLLTPLFFHRSFMVPFTAPKTLLIQGIIEILTGLWLGLMIFDKSLRPKINWISGAILVFLASILVSSLFGIDFSRSLWSSQDRSLGLVAVAHFAVYAFMLESLRDRINWRQFFGVSVGAALSAAILALVQLSKPEWFLEKVIFRPGSTLGNPSFLASYLLFNIFLSLWLGARNFEEKRKGWAGFFGLAAAFQTYILFLTETRGAILGLGAGVFVFFLYLFFRPETMGFMKKELVKRTAGGLLLASLLIPLLVWTTREAPIWKGIPGVSRLVALSSDSFDIQPRIIALKTAWEAFKERPILGYGFENYKYPFDKKFDPTLLRYGFIETYFDKPHNVVMEYLVTGGIVGLLAYLGLILVAAWRMVRKEMDGFAPFGLAILAGYFVQNVFLFDTFGSYLMLFAVLAYLMSHESSKREHVKAEETSQRKALAYGFIAVGLLAFYFYGYQSLLANNRQYWGVNYFVNREGDLGVESYIKAVETRNPYRDVAQKDFAASLSQIPAQGITITELEVVINRAMSELAKAINKHPNDYYNRIVFADAASALYPYAPQYLTVAEEQVNQAMISSPKRQQIYYAAARIKVAQGKYDEAMNFMKTAVDLDPQSPDPHFYYALTAFQAGNPALGFDEIAEANSLGRGPQTPSEARILANYYGDAGRYEESVELYIMAIQGNPDDLESKLKLGLVYYYMNDDKNARLVLEEVSKQADLTQSPFYSELKQIYASLGLAL